MNLEIGQILDQKYRIVRLLGQGAMGAVFEGENLRIKRRVAIKVLHNSVAERSDIVDRFEREAQAAGRIGSEHIVDILDLGELPDRARYMVMEFLDGESLRERIKTCGRMLPQQLLPLLRQLLVGLGAAHQAGIVHRDLKPDNVYLARQVAGHKDFVKILDFGVSKFNPLNTEEASMTQTGAVMGTPYYMSPEQAKGSRDVDGRSDLFSVGVIMYEAITGRVPFDGETFNELMFKIALQDPPPPEMLVPGLDVGLGRMIRKALAREPTHRFQDAASFIAAIDGWTAGSMPRISDPPPAGVALGAPPGQANVAAEPGAHGGTGIEWSKSGQQPAAKPKRTSVAVYAVAGVVVLGAAVFASTRFLSKDSPAPSAATASTATSTAAATATESAAATTPGTSQTAAQSAPATATSETSAQTSTAASETASASASATAPVAAKPPPGRLPSRPIETAPAKPPPPPPPAATTTSGRRPRESL